MISLPGIGGGGMAGLAPLGSASVCGIFIRAGKFLHPFTSFRVLHVTITFLHMLDRLSILASLITYNAMPVLKM